MEHNNGDSPTASHSRKQLHSSSASASLCNVSCCFCPKHRPRRHHHPLDDAAVSPVHCRLLRCSSDWIKSRAHDQLPEIKDKCGGLISRIGRSHNRHRRRHSADFHYDALSYSRNFDEGDDHDSNGEEFPFRTFSSRLPPSPPEEDEEADDDEGARFLPSPRSSTTAPKEIVLVTA